MWEKELEKLREQESIEKIEHVYKVIRLISSCHILKHKFSSLYHKLISSWFFFLGGDGGTNSISSPGTDPDTHS